MATETASSIRNLVSAMGIKGEADKTVHSKQIATSIKSTLILSNLRKHKKAKNSLHYHYITTLREKSIKEQKR